MSESETCPRCGGSRRAVIEYADLPNRCEKCELPLKFWPEWRAMQEQIERLKREHRHLARMAWWFAEHPPGTTVPDWCGLAWRSGEPVVEDEELAESEAEAIRLAAGKEGKS